MLKKTFIYISGVIKRYILSTSCGLNSKYTLYYTPRFKNNIHTYTHAYITRMHIYHHFIVVPLQCYKYSSIQSNSTTESRNAIVHRVHNTD